MKKGIIASFFILLSTIAFSQTDKKAQEILDGLSKKYKSMKSIKAVFSIEIKNEKDKSKQVQNGTIFIKGQKYKLQIAGQEIISDGKTRWTYVKDANEVQIDHQKTDENSITPTNVFTMYEKGWKSKYNGEEQKKNSTYQLIELVPVDAKSKNIFKVKLTIDKNQKTISTAVMYDKNGSIQTLTIDKFIADGAGDDAIYIFNSGSYAGAEILDLR
jgi:outer membrane lipoprotein-sorting protein